MQHLHRSEDVRLASGHHLACVETAYVTRGRLNADRTNAVLVMHGYTTGPSMLDAGSNAAEGSWSGLVGPGAAIDTERFFVICPNMLGSSYGSTGPGSLDPATGRTYGASFPDITVEDIVDAQARLLDSLGIARLHAAIGPSLGAMQAFSWGVRYPERVARVVAAVGAPHLPADAVSARAMLDRLNAEAAWTDGRYARDPKSMQPFLTRMRVQTLKFYGMDAQLSADFPDAADREREIERLAAIWAGEFDAGSLLVLARAVGPFDVRGQLQRMSAPLLFVLSRSDPVFSPALAAELTPIFDAAGLDWRYLELDSDKGHLASGADSHLWAADLARFMNEDL